MRRLLPLLAPALLITISAPAQTAYDNNALGVKKRFADRERAAISEPFEGVRTSEGVESGLFAIEPTGESTTAIVEAADAFLKALTPAQLLQTQFAVDDTEWRRWFNVDNGIYTRQGTSLREMNADQKAAARHLMATTLSARGLALADAIRQTDQTLKEINHGAIHLDEELYFFTIMGVPSATDPWGWQIDGHHLVINAFILGDQIVMTPTFLGAEPARTTTGKYAGNTVLQAEQNDALAFMQSLSADQQEAATLSREKRRNSIQAEAASDNAVVDYAGVSVATFTDAQKKQLLALAENYIGNLRDGHAAIWMDQIEAHIDDTWFAWIGATDDDAVFYYRIHSPVILIEFDHQGPVGTRSLHRGRQPVRDHIHTIIRTPNGNDYGKDLLRQHLETHHR
ncbi:MAG: DUF3500 domain-containing protein [Synoicihabitans sp.]